MGKKQYRDEYIEGMLDTIGRKLRAKEKDKLGLLGDRADLTEEQALAYEYVLLRTDEQKVYYTEKRHWDAKKLTHKQIQETLDVSEPTYYKIKRDLIDGLDEYLNARGYGYDYASNADRGDLPKTLGFGRYKVVGSDVIHQGVDYGADSDWYNYTGAGFDLPAVSFTVVSDLDFFKILYDYPAPTSEPEDSCVKAVYDFGSGKKGVEVDYEANGITSDVFETLNEILLQVNGFLYGDWDGVGEIYIAFV